MSKQIVGIHPQEQPNAIGRGGRGYVRQCTRNILPIKRRNGEVMCNRVDLTDTTKYFALKNSTKWGKR